MLALIFDCKDLTIQDELSEVARRLFEALPDVNLSSRKLYWTPSTVLSIVLTIGEGDKPDLNIVIKVDTEVPEDADTLHITFDNIDAAYKDYNISGHDVVNAFTSTISDTESYKSGNIIVAYDTEMNSFELMIEENKGTINKLANISRTLNSDECKVIAGISKGA